jgi:hypothetical protein
VGGIRVVELNLLEKEFLAAIDWRLTVSSNSPCRLRAPASHDRCSSVSLAALKAPLLTFCLFLRLSDVSARASCSRSTM